MLTGLKWILRKLGFRFEERKCRGFLRLCGASKEGFTNYMNLPNPSVIDRMWHKVNFNSEYVLDLLPNQCKRIQFALLFNDLNLCLRSHFPDDNHYAKRTSFFGLCNIFNHRDCINYHLFSVCKRFFLWKKKVKNCPVFLANCLAEDCRAEQPKREQ